MEFDKNKHIEKMAKPVEKLLAVLKKDNISFAPNDGDNNVVFTRDGKEVHMAQHSFYRFSGISSVYKEKGEFMIPVPVTDEMYLFDFMKPIIYILLDHA